jgi:hypothetical protein
MAILTWFFHRMDVCGFFDPSIDAITKCIKDQRAAAAPNSIQVLSILPAVYSLIFSLYSHTCLLAVSPLAITFLPSLKRTLLKNR